MSKGPMTSDQLQVAANLGKGVDTNSNSGLHTSNAHYENRTAEGIAQFFTVSPEGQGMAKQLFGNIDANTPPSIDTLLAKFKEGFTNKSMTDQISGFFNQQGFSLDGLSQFVEQVNKGNFKFVGETDLGKLAHELHPATLSATHNPDKGQGASH